MLVEILDSRRCTLGTIFLGFPILLVAYIQVEDLRLMVKVETLIMNPKRLYIEGRLVLYALQRRL